MIENEIGEIGAEGESERSSGSPVSTPDVFANDLPETGSEKVIAAEAEGPPNGGLNAWSQVVGSFFLFFNSWHVPRLALCYLG